MLSPTARLIAGIIVVVTALVILSISAWAAITAGDYTRLYSWGDITLGFLLAKVFGLVDGVDKSAT